MSGYPGNPYPGAPPQGPPAGAPPGPYPGGQPGQYPGGQPAGAPPGQYSGAGGYPGGHQPGAPPMGGQQGGYRPQQGGYPPQPQPGLDPQIMEWFNAVDQDRSGQIDAKELQGALVNGNMSHFSEEACRMMIDMFDRDKTGQINVNEFGALFDYINQWKGMFEGLDRDRSGSIDSNEFTQALAQMGYRFSPQFMSNLCAKYDPRGRRLTLDNFIVACVQIKRLTEGFRARDVAMQGQATLNYEDFVGLAMGAHP